MKRTNIASLGLALLAVLPLTAQAVLAYAAKEVDLRAGPARDTGGHARPGLPCR
jgi:hypothetical protein